MTRPSGGELRRLRYLLVKVPDTGQHFTAARSAVEAYLPGNYTTLTAAQPAMGEPFEVLVSGSDNAGWTLDDYVIPRLASGLYFATELKGDA